MRHGRLGLGQRVLFGQLVENAAGAHLPGRRAVVAGQLRRRGSGAPGRGFGDRLVQRRRFRQRFLVFLERLVRMVDGCRGLRGQTFVSCGQPPVAKVLDRLERRGRTRVRRLLVHGNGPERTGHRRHWLVRTRCRGRRTVMRRCRLLWSGGRGLCRPFAVIKIGGHWYRLRLLWLWFLLWSVQRFRRFGGRRSLGRHLWFLVPFVLVRSQLHQCGWRHGYALTRRLETVPVGSVLDDAQLARVVHVTVFTRHFTSHRLGFDLEWSARSLVPVSVWSVFVEKAKLKKKKKIYLPEHYNYYTPKNIKYEILPIA